MNHDRNILIGFFIITLIVYGAGDGTDWLPVGLLGLGLIIFFLEMRLIGQSLSFVAMTVPSFFLFGYIVLLVMPMVLLFNLVESNAKYLYLHSLLVTLIVFPFGVWVANLTRSYSYRSGWQSLYADRKDQKFEFFFWLLLVISFIGLMLFVIFSVRIQLIDLLTGSSANIDEMSMRFAQIELPKPVQYIFEVTRRVLLPICVLFAYFMKWLHGGKWRYIFPIIFVISLFVSLLTLDRSPPLGLFAMLATAYFIVHKGSRKLRWPLIIGLAVLALLVAGIVSIFQYQTETISVGQIFEVAWYVVTVRIFESPITMAMYAFETYNYDTKFLYGEYVRLFSFLPGFEYAESMGDTEPFGAAPVTFVGDLWRNWGWIGIIGGAFSFGFIFQAIQVAIFNKLTVARASVYILLLWGSLAILHGKAIGILTLSVIFLGAGLGLIIRHIEDQKTTGMLVNRSRTTK